MRAQGTDVQACRHERPVNFPEPNYNRRMTTSSSAAPASRRTFLTGLALAIAGAILFSAKAIVAKLIYRYPVDAVTLIGFRMLFSLLFFAAIALWKTRTEAPLPRAEQIRIVLLGLIGYYLSSFLDFIGLQYISAGLERLILFLPPTFVLLISVLFLKKKIGRLQWMALLISYVGIMLVLLHDVKAGGSDVTKGSLFVLASALSYSLYLLWSGELVQRVGAMRLVAYAMCVSSAACIIQFFLLRPVSLLMLPAVLTMAGVARIGAATASQAGMVGPVSTLFMGALLLSEPITAVQLMGTGLVLSGIYLLSKKKA